MKKYTIITKICGICLAILLVALTLTVACAPSPTPTPTPTPTPKPTPTPTATPTEPIEIIFSNYNPEGHDNNKAWRYFMEEVKKRTDKVEFTVYYGGALGGSRDMLPYVRDGVADIGVIMPGYYPAELNLATITGIPYTTVPLDSRMKAFAQVVQEFPEVKAEFDAQNQKFFMAVFGTECIVVSTKRVQTVADLKGMKLRSAGADEQTLEAWGAVPVTTSFGEIYESLSRGVIDAVPMPPSTAVSAGWHEIAKYWFQTGYGTCGGGVVTMNLDTWNSLPSDIQQVFNEAVEATTAGYADIRENAQREVIPTILESDGEIYALSDDVKAELEALGKAPLHDAWIAEAIAAGYSEELARGVIERFIELAKMYEPQATFKPFITIYETEFK